MQHSPPLHYSPVLAAKRLSVLIIQHVGSTQPQMIPTNPAHLAQPLHMDLPRITRRRINNGNFHKSNRRRNIYIIWRNVRYQYAI